MDAFFGDPLKKIISHTLTAREWSGSLALMDWLETPTSHIFKINVPGYSKDELKMQVEEGGKVLHIRGEVKKEDPSVKDAIWHVSERGAIKGEFNRVIRLPENVNLDEIKAKIEDGVLTVIVPKESASKSSKLRPISISSSSKL